MKAYARARVEAVAPLLQDATQRGGTSVRGGLKRGWSSRGAILALAGSTCTALPAAAQSFYDRSENVAVTSRAHPEYDALGVRVGAFTAYPRISLSGTYDDNIYALPSKTSGFIASVTPSVDFASNWTRNALDFQLRYERDEYVDQPSQSSNELALTSTGRMDIDHASTATFTFSVARLTEPRTAPDSFATLRNPVRYDLIGTGGTIYREFNRWRVDLEVNNAFYSFFDDPLLGGGVYPESQRDENNTSERVRLSYAIDPGLALFAQITPNQSHFLRSPVNDPGTIATTGFSNLDSSGYSWLIGVNGQITHLVTADAGVGYLEQSYADPRIPKVTGTAYNVDLHYYPTQLLTVTGSASHSVAASGLPGTPASDLDQVAVRADYELRRSIIISPNLSYAKYRYPGTSRVDDRFGGGVSLTYLVNRTIGLTGSYAYLEQDSNATFGGYNFNDNRFTLTLTLQR